MNSCSFTISFRAFDISPKGYEKSFASKPIFSLNAMRDLLMLRVASVFGRCVMCAYCAGRMPKVAPSYRLIFLSVFQSRWFGIFVLSLAMKTVKGRLFSMSRGIAC